MWNTEEGYHGADVPNSLYIYIYYIDTLVYDMMSWSGGVGRQDP